MVSSPKISFQSAIDFFFHFRRNPKGSFAEIVCMNWAEFVRS
ncbi:hypothetical protein LINPERPRIM_LOCUS4712 [Linum perenne]